MVGRAKREDFPIIEEQNLDFVNPQGNARMMAENDLAIQKALYKGHAVAAVAAISPHIAEEALNLIKVDYEVLPAVLTVQEAMKESAPILTIWTRTQGAFGIRATVSAIFGIPESAVKVIPMEVGGGFGPYNIDGLLADGYDVVCNKPKTQAYRASGPPQAFG